MGCLQSYFGGIADPRRGKVTFRLGDLIVMMIAVSLCGATTATEFALFAEQRRPVLLRLIDYEAAPSHDTFSRLLRLLDPCAFAQAFAAFASAFAQARGGVVSLDGKALKRAYESGLAASPPLTVSAFASQTRLCLAACPASGANEVETALKVVNLMDLTDTLVTADALHCHTRMARAIVERGGNYLLALKGNRRSWQHRALKTLDAAPAADAAETCNAAHGRREWRRAEGVGAAEHLMEEHKAFVRITSRRNQAKPTTRLFMASTLMTPHQALEAARAHWQIENGLHWMLDVHLHEDQSRARKNNAPANTALLNRIARNILQTADAKPVPISHRIRKCAWNDEYLFNAIATVQ